MNKSISIGVLAVLSMAVGCGPKLGDPVAPTSSQQQASVQLTSSIDTIGKLKTSSDSAFSLYGMTASIGSQAVDPNAKRSALSTEEVAAMVGTMSFPTGCVSGDAATGWTYTACTDQGVTVDGSVKFSGQTTTIDLTIKVTNQANVTVHFKGSITDTGSKITGSLSYDYKVDLGIVGGLPGANAGNISTTVTYDITYSTNPYCITGGTIRVDNNYAGMSGVAQFEWTACDMFKVRNG